MESNSLLADIDISEFPEPQRALAECLGLDAFMKLTYNYGGVHLYIPKHEAVLRVARDKRIRSEYDGYNRRALALKYGISSVQIGRIIRSP